MPSVRVPARARRVKSVRVRDDVAISWNSGAWENKRDDHATHARVLAL